MELKNRRIGVFGVGRSGMAALEFLHGQKSDVFAVDRNSPDLWPQRDEIDKISSSIPCFSEESALEALAEASAIIISPGIPREHPLLNYPHERKIPIWSEVELASRFIKTPIVAVTGSNGKTTVVSLMEEILHHCDISAFVGGNTGTPFCSLLLESRSVDLVVLELSSFHLESIEHFHPQVAVILNIFPNHGERYKCMDDYKKAKLNICKNMNEKDVILHPDYLTPPQSCRARRFSFEDISQQKVLESFDLSDFSMMGEHNRFNLFVAISSLSFLVEKEKLNEKVQSAIDCFSGVPHRLSPIKSPCLFRPFNDAKCSNWEGVLMALDSMDEPVYLILGGQKRHRHDSALPYLARLVGEVKKVLLIGEMAEQLKIELGDLVDCTVSGTLECAVEEVKKEKWKGPLLFSPGYPSFDQFRDYTERGELFLKLVGDFS